MAYIIFLILFFIAPATTEPYTLSLHDALPICGRPRAARRKPPGPASVASSWATTRSEEHTSELQSPVHLVCRLLLEKKKKNVTMAYIIVVNPMMMAGAGIDQGAASTAACLVAE